MLDPHGDLFDASGRGGPVGRKWPTADGDLETRQARSYAAPMGVRRGCGAALMTAEDDLRDESELRAAPCVGVSKGMEHVLLTGWRVP